MNIVRINLYVTATVNSTEIRNFAPFLIVLMLTLPVIQNDTATVIERLILKRFHQAETVVQTILSLNEDRKKHITELERLRAEMNRIAKSVGAEMAKGNQEAAEEAKKQTQVLKQNIADLEITVREVETALQDQLVLLPNLPHESVPAGKSAEDNAIIQQVAQAPATIAQEKLQPHWELTKKLNIIDFETGSKVTGAGFPFYKNKGAKLQRALISFFLDEATRAGYTEYIPPLVVNADSGFATGQLPDKEGQMYFITEDQLYLIPTAEVPLTNIYRDEILEEELLPLKLCGYTPCFRREAGSYGKDVRGLNRLHQFDKVEIVQIVHPDVSYNVLEEMLAHVQGLLTKLGLYYRTALLCGGDIGFASAKTYDMEVFSAAQERWLEVSSVSNFESFQANRLKLRYKDKATKKTNLCHTLNGSALALPRIVACLLEQYQTEEGTIRIPDALVPYTGFSVID